MHKTLSVAIGNSWLRPVMIIIYYIYKAHLLAYTSNGLTIITLQVIWTCSSQCHFNSPRNTQLNCFHWCTELVHSHTHLLSNQIPYIIGYRRVKSAECGDTNGDHLTSPMVVRSLPSLYRPRQS